MTVASTQLAEGWNPPKVTGEPGLHIYVAKNGSETAYFKGRVNEKNKTIRLHPDTRTGWKRQVRVLRGDQDAAETAAGSRTVKVGDYALGPYAARQRSLVGHLDPGKRRSRRGVENDIYRIERFIAPTRLGRMKFGDVRVSHVRAWLTELETLTKSNGERYAPGTLGDITRILGGIFHEGVRDGLAPRSAVGELEYRERPSRKPLAKKRYLTPAQVDAVVEGTGPAHRPIVFVCAWAGMRISEVLGLTWADLDLEAGTMTVAAQLDTPQKGLVDTKTENSKATVPLLPAVVEMLKEHKKTMTRRGLHLVRGDAHVFVTWPMGLPQHRTNVLRSLQLSADRLGLNTDADGKPIKKVDLHSLRHSLITNGIDAGMTHAEMAIIARNDERTIVQFYSSVAESNRGTVGLKLAEKLGRSA